MSSSLSSPICPSARCLSLLVVGSLSRGVYGGNVEFKKLNRKRLGKGKKLFLRVGGFVHVAEDGSCDGGCFRRQWTKCGPKRQNLANPFKIHL
jgi:hypothetical protein